MFKNGKKTLSFLLAIAMIATLIPANIAFASTAEKGTALADRSGIETDIRFALFGDTHVTVNPVWTTADAALDKIMDAYKTIDANMDAFVMPGDVIYNVAPADEKTTDDVVKYNAVLAEIKEDFPNASTTSTDTTEANIIWSMGNHEITLGAYKGTATTNFTAGDWKAEVADNHAKYEEALGRKPIDTYTVNGYTFVTSAPYDYLNNYVNPDDKTVMSAYETTIKGYLEAALKADSTKPVFYLQHEAIDRTNIASATAENPTRNSAEFREFVVSNPRIITLSGHSHYAANDPRTFLQLDNGSTHINIPATMGAAGSYGCTKDSVTNNASATQGMLVEVTGAEVTVRAFDYVDKKYIGEPYVFTAGAAAKTEYTKAGREAAKTSEVNKAYFESGAAITVSDIESKSAKISFPEGKKDGESAANLHDDYIHYYRVKVTNKATGNTVKSYSLLGNYLLNSTNSKKTANREVTLSGLSRGTEYTVTVTPESALGQQGTPLTVDFTTSADKTAEDLALTKKFNQNVALNKPVTSVGVGTADDTVGNISPNYVATELTDGTNDFVEIRDGLEGITGKTSLIVDLGNAYNITKVVLKSRKDAQDDNGRKNFNILASNDPEFKTSDKLGGMGSSTNSTIFPVKGDFTIECDSVKGYRYIKLERTAGAYCCYSELEVYADVYMTEISRKKPTETNVLWYDWAKPSYAVDGINTTKNDGWWSAYPGANNGKIKTFGTDAINDYLIVDLEEKYMVSRIDVEYPNGISDNTGSRQGWAVYGSNELSEKGTSGIEGYAAEYRPDMTKSSMPSEFERLCWTGTGYYIPKYGAENVYKMYGNAVDTVGTISQLVTPSQKYQYITFKKLNNNIAQLGEVRVWVNNPYISSTEKSGNEIVIRFSEEMNIETLNANNIKLYNVDGSEISGTYSVSEAGKVLTITGDNVSNAFKLEASYFVTGASGMDIAGELVKYFENTDVDYSGKPVIVEENVKVSKGRPAIVDKANVKEEKDENGNPIYTVESVEKVKWSNITDDDLSTMNSVYVSKNGAITIDLEKSYNIKKIVLDVTDVSQAKQTYKIQVSNDPDFTDSTTKTVASRGPVGELYEATEWVNGTTLTINLDGSEFYRYVRYLNTTGADFKYLYINEFEVYADRNLMEISRNASTTTNAVYSSEQMHGAQYIVDGEKNKSYDSNYYFSGWNSAFNWIDIDLGVKVPVVRVEIESPYDGLGRCDYNARRAWGVYGSNIAPNADDIATGVTKQGSGCYELTTDGYTKLGRTNYLYPSYNSGNFDEKVYYTFAECESAVWNVKNGILRLDTFGQYQHIMLHRGLTGAAVLGEARVYTIAPKASAKLNGNTVTVNFSEKIFPSYMISDNFTLYDSENNLIAYSNAKAVDDDTFTFTADFKPGETYKVVVDKSVKTVSSMPLNIDNEITIVVPNISTSVTVKVKDTDETAESFVAGTAYNFDVAVASPFAADEPNVKVVVAQYNGDQLVKAELADITAVANNTTNAVLTNFTYAEGNTFKVFAWKATFDEPYCAVIELGIQE